LSSERKNTIGYSESKHAYSERKQSSVVDDAPKSSIAQEPIDDEYPSDSDQGSKQTSMVDEYEQDSSKKSSMVQQIESAKSEQDNDSIEDKYSEAKSSAKQASASIAYSEP
jgi:hypothetical protein